jgi:hypothetical protein
MWFAARLLDDADPACGRPYTRLTHPRKGTAMAVGIRLKCAGGTQENYDTAHAVMEIDSAAALGDIP